MLAHEGAADACALLCRVDIDAVEFGLGPAAVVVQIADDGPPAFGDEEVRAVAACAGFDAVSQARDGVRLSDDQVDHRGLEHALVKRRERDPADGSNRARVGGNRLVHLRLVARPTATRSGASTARTVLAACRSHPPEGARGVAPFRAREYDAIAA
jgi:hypothetical protein